jgi:hypothetical protein
MITKTEWEVWEYDVWGNKIDGYDVNDRFCINRHCTLKLNVNTYNQDTPQEFKGANISDYKLKQLFGVSCKLDVQGDDLSYYVNRESDGYPIGELFCISHDSLSPIRIKIDFTFKE